MTENRSSHAVHSLRLPAEIKEKLAGSAQANFRSLNSEIVKRLKDSLRTEDAPTAANG